MEELLELIKKRRSVRKFNGKPIPKEYLEKIVDCGRFAPSARNLQPWYFIVVTDAGIRQELVQYVTTGPFIKDAPACIAVACSDAKYYLEDGSAATQNILLAAEALGLSSCWVAGDKKDYAPQVKKTLNIPDDYNLVSLIALGYSDDQPRSKKKDLAEVLIWEKMGE